MAIDSTQAIRVYDQRGRLWQVGDAVDPDRYAALTYTTRNETDQMVLDDSVQIIDYKYNGRGWLTFINNPGDLGTDKFGEWLRYQGDTVSWPGYYNGNIGGQRLKVAGEDEEKHHYRYDQLDRLIKDSIPDPSEGYLHEVFAYDANGNRSSYDYRPSFISDPTHNTYYYSGRLAGGNQMDSVHRGGVNSLIETYDANGNLWYNSSKQMTSGYDIYNQLDTVFRDNGSLPDNALSFGYSVGGERVWKQYRYCWADTCPDTGIIITEPPEGMVGFVTEDVGAQTDGTTPPPGGEPAICTFCDTVLTWYIVSNCKVLAEYDGLTRRLHYKHIYAGDQRIAMRDGVNRLHYYLNDHLGSARVVIDSVGTINK